MRRDGAVRKEAFYSLLGVLPDRTREVLGVVAYPTESATGWRNIFSDLKQRGLTEIGLVFSDGLKGIENAVAAEFSGTNRTDITGTKRTETDWAARQNWHRSNRNA